MCIRDRTIILNIYGTLTLIDGAIYSAYTFQRQHWRTEEMMDVSLRLRAVMVGQSPTIMAGQAAFVGLLEDFTEDNHGLLSWQASTG